MRAILIGRLSSVTSTDAIGIGYSVLASGKGAIGIGANASARDSGSIAIGDRAYVSGSSTDLNSIAIGTQASASAVEAIAMGANSEARGDNSIAIGKDSFAQQISTTAIGNKAYASGNEAIAIGQARVTGTQCIAIGHNVTGSSGYGSVTIGDNINALAAYDAISIGKNTSPDWYSVVIGVNASATAYDATAIGYSADAGYYGTAIGESAQATGQSSVGIGAGYGGGNAQATAISSIAIGGGDGGGVNGARATANRAIAIGQQSLADATSAIAIGWGADAGGVDAIAIGSGSNSGGGQAITIGHNLTNTANPSIAIGKDFNQSSAGSLISIGFDLEPVSLSGQSILIGVGSKGVGGIGQANRQVNIGNKSFTYGDDSIAIGNRASGSTDGFAIGPYVHVGSPSSIVANVGELGLWTDETTRTSAIRMHGNTRMVSLTLQDRSTTYTDGGATLGDETDNTLMRDSYAIRMDGNELFIDHNSASVIHSISLTTSSNSVYGFFAEVSSMSLYALDAGGKDKFGISLDGGGSVIPTGSFADSVVPFDCTMSYYVMYADQTGYLEVDVLTSDYASYPTFTSVTGSTGALIDTDIKSQDLTLSGWSKNLSEGDVVRFNVVTSSQMESANLTFIVNKK
jgi:hypothetical protein